MDSKAPPAKPPLNSMPGSRISDFLKLLHARWRQELKKCNPKAPALLEPSGLLLNCPISLWTSDDTEQFHQGCPACFTIVWAAIQQKDFKGLDKASIKTARLFI